MPNNTYRPEHLAVMYENANAVLQKWEKMYEEFAEEVEDYRAKNALKNETKRKRGRPAGSTRAALKLKERRQNEVAKMRVFAATCERKRDKKKREKRC